MANKITANRTKKDDIREQLVGELTAANSSDRYSRDMVRWIEAGTLVLSPHHSDLALNLAATLAPKAAR